MYVLHQGPFELFHHFKYTFEVVELKYINLKIKQVFQTLKNFNKIKYCTE